MFFMKFFRQPIFTEQCATQYDYDKLTIHAGSTVNAKKVTICP
jgi:hypothetical protein